MKRCSKCGDTKPFSEFHKSKSRKDGYKCHCKDCRHESRKRLYHNNKSILGYYIYQHSIKSTGEVFYIGSGCSNRAWESSKRNDTWNEIVKQYGFPEVEIIDKNLTKRQALDKEQELQKQVKPKANFRYGAGRGQWRGKSSGKAKPVINCKGEVFETVSEASRKYGRSTSNISRACKGQINYSGKYSDGTPIQWDYYEQTD